MTRICECGCQQAVEGRGRFVDASHRARAWRQSHVKAGPVDHPRSGLNARSGRQVSYAKAVDEVAALLAGRFGLLNAREIAEQTMSRVLSERQRAQS